MPKDPKKRWIHIPKWDEFQYRSDAELPWIKFHSRLTRKQKWLDLSFEQRGILTSLWQEYAHENRARGTTSTLRGLPDDTRSLCRRTGQRVLRPQLIRLEQAGFIVFAAQTVRATARTNRAPREREKEYITPKPPYKESENPETISIEKARTERRQADTEHRRHQKHTATARSQYETWKTEMGPTLAAHTLRDAYPHLAQNILETA